MACWLHTNRAGPDEAPSLRMPTDADTNAAAPPWLVRMTTARWAFVVLAAALAGILVFSTVATWSSARQAYDTLVQGQASDLFHAVRRALPPEPHPTEDHTIDRERITSALEAVLAEHAEVGLRHIALLDGDHELVARVGQSIEGEGASRPPPPGRVIEHDGVVRAAAPGGAPHGPPPAKAPGMRRPPHPGQVIVIEFEPAIGTELQAQARRSLAIGIAGAVGLLLVGAVFFALSRRALAIEARLVEQQHLASLGEMSAVLAHELRNPLTSLRGNAQLLEGLLTSTPNDGRAQQKIRRVIAETTRLQQLIDGLLDFARSGTITRAPVDPRALARDAVADVDAERIVIVDDDAPAMWSLDAARMRQVLVNLLTNAIQAAPAESKVTLRVGRRGDRLLLAVEDRGEGVPEALRAGLFAAFRTSKTHGVGLGLAVARRIAELHRGTLVLLDRTGPPTVFEVVIPDAP